MSYDTAQDIAPENMFSWGYVDNTPDSTLADKYSPNSRNTRLDGMATVSRPWHSLQTTLTAGDYPRGIWSYLRTVKANDRIIVRHNTDATHKLYTIDEDWVATSITTAWNIASDNRMSFLNTWDVIYCMNGSDDYWKLSATTYTTPSTGITNFAPAFAVTFNWSVFASGWAAWDSKLVYKSVWDDYEDFNSAWSDTFSFEEQITWLAKHSQALFYFTQNTISVTGESDIQDIWGAINYTTRWLTVKEWSVNHASLVSVWNNIFAITPSNKIIKISRWANIDWFEVFELSERKYSWITKIMSTLDSDQTDCFGYYLPKESLIKWFFKSKNATFNDTCIVYDVTKDAFLPDTNKYFYGWVDFKWKNYTISTIEPKVYLDEYGYDDEGAAISFRYETKYMDLWIPTIKKELWEASSYVAINSLAELNQSILIDGNTVDTKVIDKDNIPITTWWIWTAPVWVFAIWTGWWFTWEDKLSYVDLIRTKGNLQKKGKKIKVIFTNDALAGRIRLENFQMKVEILSTSAINLTK